MARALEGTNFYDVNYESFPDYYLDFWKRHVYDMLDKKVSKDPLYTLTFISHQGLHTTSRNQTENGYSNMQRTTWITDCAKHTKSTKKSTEYSYVSKNENGCLTIQRSYTLRDSKTISSYTKFCEICTTRFSSTRKMSSGIQLIEMAITLCPACRITSGMSC